MIGLESVGLAREKQVLFNAPSSIQMQAMWSPDSTDWTFTQTIRIRIYFFF